MKKKLTLTNQTFLAMVLGLLLGTLGHWLAGQSWVPDIVNYSLNEVFIENILAAVGKIFVNTLKLLVVPLVFVSLVCGTCSPNGDVSLGRIGGKTFMLYLLTTAVAIALALLIGVLVQPGAEANLSSEQTFNPKQAPPLQQVLINIFPSNPIKAMSEGNMLQVIVFSILLGVSISRSGDVGVRVAETFKNWNTVIMKLVEVVMIIAPYGVFSLIAVLFAEKGITFIGDLAKYFFTVVAVLLLHALGTFNLLLVALAKISPIKFFSKMRPVLMFGFSTASSGATMPLTLKVVEEKLGVDNKVASFTVPLGATINMDGTAIMQGVATVFIAQAYGIGLGIEDYLLVITTAVLASIGTAAVPGAGMITLAMVLGQVGLPVEAIGLIIGVDRLLDMIRTAVNITGDATVSCVIAKSENEFNDEVFNSP